MRAVGCQSGLSCDSRCLRRASGTAGDMLRGLNEYVKAHHAKVVVTPMLLSHFPAEDGLALLTALSWRRQGLNWNMEGVDFETLREEASEELGGPSLSGGESSPTRSP